MEDSTIARSIAQIGLALVSGDNFKSDTKIQEVYFKKDQQPLDDTRENIENMSIPFWQLKDFIKEPTYHEQMTRKEAEKKLKEQGSSRCFLTRYSDTNKANKISVMNGSVKNKFEHFEISRTKYALKDSHLEFETVSEMLRYYQTHKISDTLRNIGVPVVYSEDTGSKDRPSPAADQPKSNNRSVRGNRDEHYVTLAQPAYLARRRTVITGITQYPCYQGLISADEARQRLEQQPGNSYLVRFSDSQKKYMISVLKRGDENAVIFQNFIINTEAKNDQHEYEIEGSQKRFDNFSDLLDYYEKYPISAEINCIGTPSFFSNPPLSPNYGSLRRLRTNQVTPKNSFSGSSRSYTPGPESQDCSSTSIPKLMIDTQSSGLLPPPDTNLSKSPSPSPSLNSLYDGIYTENNIYPQDVPSLVKFISFPMADSKVNLAEKIGVNYHDFGVLLLKDNAGDLISSIVTEQRGNAYGINREVFILWLRGKGKQPVTWDTLVTVLHDIGLDKLANDIDNVTHNSLSGSSDIDN